MEDFGEKINEKFFKLPGYVQFIFSWIIIIGAIVLFFWLNNNYFHLPIGGGNDVCSGTFEHNCGDIEDADYRVDDYN